MPTVEEEAVVRRISRQWAWNIREDGRDLPPDLLRMAMIETARALNELADEMSNG